MKHIVRKAYFDYEKEEAWLNQMASHGMALADYSWCRYVFEDAPYGKWVYRLELLEHLPVHPESVAYLRFMEENGVEVVATYLRWVYLRKPAEEGSFDLYSDLTSKIAHYQRIHLLWLPLMLLQFFVGFQNLFLGLADGRISSPVNIVLGILLIGIGLLLLRLDVKVLTKIRRLRQEQRIRE